MARKPAASKKPEELEGMPEHPPELPTKFTLNQGGKFRLRGDLEGFEEIKLLVTAKVKHLGTDFLETGGDSTEEDEPAARPTAVLQVISCIEVAKR